MGIISGSMGAKNYILSSKTVCLCSIREIEKSPYLGRRNQDLTISLPYRSVMRNTNSCPALKMIITIFAQGDLDGVCYLYSIANSYVALKSIAILKSENVGHKQHAQPI